MADFIRQEVIEGIQRLYTLRLQGAPPEDGVVATAEVWVAALKKRFAGWSEEQDAGRIGQGFDELVATALRWPSPALLIGKIPPRKVQARLTAPRAAFTDAQRAANKKRMAAILAGLVEKMNMN